MSPARRPEDPVGTVTRGTTNPNRLRRVDRWIAGTQAHRLRSRIRPVVVDLGYGATPITALELHERLRSVAPDVEVVGLEISRERVAAALPLARPGVSFAVGGFEVPLPGGASASIIRAFNVLRQYAEEDVPDAWERMRSRLTPDGLLVEGTCDELGRRSAWVALDRTGPLSLTLSWRLRGLERPSAIAERLPKALIHRNVPGEPVHDLLRRIDDAWDRSAGHASWGARQRFIATAESLRDGGVPVFGGRARWRLGELTVPWPAVAPERSARAHQGP
jgi:hypothetical protein